MQDLEKQGYSYDEVKKALLSSREIKFEYELLDKEDRKIGTIPEVSGSYSFYADGEIKGIGRFNINEKYLKDINLLSERIKPYFHLKINSDWLKWGQGIYLLSAPNRNEEKGSVYRDIDAYDKGLILKEDQVDNRYFIPKGTYYTNVIRELILSTGIQKISIQESDLTLSIDKEYEIGTSKLEIINDLLKAINYNSVYFDENGFCMVRKYMNPIERPYEFEYSTNNESVTLYGANETLDSYNIPNKFVRYVENPEADYMIASYVNDKASNPLSTVNRGRTITDIKAITDIPDQATLNDYVERIAFEKSQVFGGLVFNTLPMPHHTYLDCLRIKNDVLGISEKYIETSWNVDASVNGVMSHVCRKVVPL